MSYIRFTGAFEASSHRESSYELGKGQRVSKSKTSIKFR